MSVGLFTDRAHPPTDDEILAAVGRKVTLWQGVLQFIRTTYTAQQDLKLMYGHPHGWALRFRTRGKLLTALYPTAGDFTVQLILSTAAIEQAQSLQVGQHVQQVIAAAHPYPEGRWLFIPVETENDIHDIQQLLPLRAEIKRVRRSR